MKGLKFRVPNEAMPIAGITALGATPTPMPGGEVYTALQSWTPFLRLEALLDKPEQRNIMGPMLVKEIHFRVLLGRDGHKLRSFYTYGSQRNQIAKAIAWLKENYKRHVTVEELASHVHMATATFHRHFKDTTAISPLQFQKRLRLHEAQRLMIMENADVPTACNTVGYESLTQFTREYKRLFGEPPRRNVTRWQEGNAAAFVLGA